MRRYRSCDNLIISLRRCSTFNPPIEKIAPADHRMLQETVEAIELPDPGWLAHARSHLDCLTKPIGSLGRLEEIAAKVVSIQQTTLPHVERKTVYVFAADHGITEEGVSAYPKEVTRQMVLNFLNGGAAINVIAQHVGSEVVIVDVGVDADFSSVHGMLHRKIGRGTRSEE